MRTFNLSILLFIVAINGFSQNFTWVKGNNAAGDVGVYGTQGVSAPGNTPGARHGCATWTDLNGNLWLFGGEGCSTSPSETLLNDLWKYNPGTNEWTWMRGSTGGDSPGSYGTLGVASPLNDPSAREFMTSWTDDLGNFWLFGGDGVSQTVAILGDLWKYDPLTNEWTWMKGPNTANNTGVYGSLNVAAATNLPGNRGLSTGWTDNAGKFWLFGGRGFGGVTSGTLNDLWRYDPVTNEWTWVSGSSAVNQPGVYGTMGVAAPGNYPGGHTSSSPFISPQGHLVLCAGNGYASTASPGYLNDMWEFNISTGNWTWISGSNMGTALASYGTLGVASATTFPGGRMSAAAWTDISGNYWMFGGNGLIASSTVDQLSDLFMYNPVTNQWTWVKGPNQSSQNGTYGTQGVAAAGNMPGSRYYNTWWKNTSTGALWMFGGLGYDVSMNITENMNDLWKLTLPCNPDSAIAQSSSPICSGNTMTLNAYNLYPAQVSWFTSPTSTSTIANGSSFSTPSLLATSGTSVYTYYAGSTNCTISPRAVVNVTVMPLPMVGITGSASLCPMQTGTVTATGAQSYTWNSGVQTTTTTLQSGSSISVTGIGSNGCINTTSFAMGVYPLPNLGASSSSSLSCAGEPVTITASGSATYTWDNGNQGANITVSPTLTSSYVLNGVSENGCSKTYTFTQYVAACVGIDQKDADAGGVSLYPNPNKGHFMISVNQQSKLTLFNALGQRLLEQDVAKGQNQLSLDITPGVYVYVLRSNHKQYKTGKLIIE